MSLNGEENKYITGDAETDESVMMLARAVAKAYEQEVTAVINPVKYKTILDIKRRLSLILNNSGINPEEHIKIEVNPVFDMCTLSLHITDITIKKPDIKEFVSIIRECGELEMVSLNTGVAEINLTYREVFI